MYALITIINYIPKVHNAFNKNTLCKFAQVDHDKIDLFDITEMDKISGYQVVMLDQVAMTKALEYIPSIDSEYLINKLSKITCKKGIFLYDMHNWSYMHLLKSENQPANKNVGYVAMKKFLDKTDITFFVSYNNCDEFDFLKDIFTYDKTYILHHFVNTNKFKDHQLDKIYDVLVYGVTDEQFYPLRYRLVNILKKLKINLRVIHPNKLYNEQVSGENLSKLINQSWLCLATGGFSEYLVKKFFEISASNTVVFGSMPLDGKKIWTNNYVEVNSEMSDQEIEDIIANALQNKNKLKEMANIMYPIIHNNFTLPKFIDKVFNIFEDINSYQPKPQVFTEITSVRQFNLAKFYTDYGDKHRAVLELNNKLEMGGTDEEIYWCYLYLAEIQKSIDYNLKAIQLLPDRIEAYHQLSQFYNNNNDAKMAYHYAKMMIDLKVPTKYTLYHDEPMYVWGRYDHFSLMAYKNQKYNEALITIIKLLQENNYNKKHKPRLLKNLEWYFKKFTKTL